MTTQAECSRNAAYFEALYNANPDPWNFSTSIYEHGKYQATMMALEGKRFSSAFEIGCSIGVLTRILATRCTSLLAVDIVETALSAARIRCGNMSNVEFAKLHVPDQWPVEKTFDLIVISEVLYFLCPTDVVRVADHVVSSLLAGGTILLVNYTEQINEPSSGDQAAEMFISTSRLKLNLSLQQRHEKFRIDRLERNRE